MLEGRRDATLMCVEGYCSLENRDKHLSRLGDLERQRGAAVSRWGKPAGRKRRKGIEAWKEGRPGDRSFGG